MPEVAAAESVDTSWLPESWWRAVDPAWPARNLLLARAVVKGHFIAIECSVDVATGRIWHILMRSFEPSSVGEWKWRGDQSNACSYEPEMPGPRDVLSHMLESLTQGFAVQVEPARPAWCPPAYIFRITGFDTFKLSLGGGEGGGTGGGPKPLVAVVGAAMAGVRTVRCFGPTAPHEGVALVFNDSGLKQYLVERAEWYLTTP